MPHPFRTARLAAAALLLLPLAACDETGGPSGGSAEEQIRDAQFARQAGRTGEALQILDAAFAQYPESAPVRVAYSLTILEDRRIDLLDLDRVARYLTTAEAGAPSGGGSTSPFCPYAADPTAQPFDPTDYAGFTAIQSDRGALRRALSLLDPVIPAALQDLDPCTSVVHAPDGTASLAYDAQAALAGLRAGGLRDDQIGDALATNALARFLNAYLTLTDDLPPETTWYRLNGGSAVGICTDDPVAVAPIANEAVRDMGEALFSIDLRAVSAGRTATSRQLVDLVIESYEEVRDGVARTCTP